MYKVFMTVRNRLAITKKAIKALHKHSKIPFQLYVYDNSSNYLLNEHFEYFRDLYKDGKIAQICFTTVDSTFNAFSKASTCNFFGLQHEQDPRKDTYDFLLFVDSDIIVQPEFDKILLNAWNKVKHLKWNNIKVIGQQRGGIKNKTECKEKIAGCSAVQGKLGGSGFWCVKPNFFSEIGYLSLRTLVGQNKRHDISYWRLMDSKTNGQPYILGLRADLRVHCGKIAGSTCNILTKKPKNKAMELIKFKDAEELIESMSFKEFYKIVTTDPKFANDW